ncbi:unnamed protein product [Leptidea sinapis]|uniref:Uncharacterized protein n=1 Tax=Leptidea sinapis TaxID=189913 RepID=A0A5E4QA94_9NEOP|nr:unnamed protein product [Leptidea sinapis]
MLYNHCGNYSKLARSGRQSRIINIGEIIKHGVPSFSSGVTSFGTSEHRDRLIWDHRQKSKIRLLWSRS